MRRTVVGGAKDEWEEPISDPEDAGVNEVRLPQTRLSDVEFVQSTRDAFSRRLEVLEDKVKYYEEPMEESNVLLVLRLSLDLINFVMGVTVLAGVADDARFQELNPIPSVGISAVAGAWALVAYVAFAAHASFWGFDAKTFWRLAMVLMALYAAALAGTDVGAATSFAAVGLLVATWLVAEWLLRACCARCCRCCPQKCAKTCGTDVRMRMIRRP